MNQIIYNRDLQRVGQALNSNNPQFTSNNYQSDDKKIDVNFSMFKPAEREAMIAEVIRLGNDLTNKNQKHYKTISRKLTDWQELVNNVGGSAGEPIKTLEKIPAALQGYMTDAPHKWVFVTEGDGAVTPWFLQNCTYHKGYMERGTYHPAHTDITIVAYKRGSKRSKSYTWYKNDTGRTIAAMLRSLRWFKETPEAVTSYQAQFKRFATLQGECGLQMQAVGTAEEMESKGYYRSSTAQMVREGIPSKVVLDDETEESTSNQRGSRNDDRFYLDQFWGQGNIQILDGMPPPSEQPIVERESEDEDDGDDADFEEATNKVALPIHPYLRVFDLNRHEWLVIHQDNLEDYPWDKTLGEKLILKEEDKRLINLLINSTSERTEDIIKGKMAGVIILATGVPGVGKTLTAEVLSEMIERPLYNVQCSQLGLDVAEIEKNLEKILARAARWNSILLMDEADVYIRKRGEDIHQNAIVGVFLRLLEYYRGVIFMTSNRGDEVDDAIISRATAWVKYEKPDAKMLRTIWRTLSTQYGITFSEDELDELITLFPEGLSGRAVRNILKLAKMLITGDNKKIGPSTIKNVAKYQSLD